MIAVASSKPLGALPDVATVSQAGFPDLTNEGAYGILAPAGTPKVMVEQIIQASRALLADRDLQNMLLEFGVQTTPDSNPDDFRQLLHAALARWEPVVKKLDLKID
jgi:tripartite-type tricarboxylate transporter receptor subunit TctC